MYLKSIKQIYRCCELLNNWCISHVNTCVQSACWCTCKFV